MFDEQPKRKYNDQGGWKGFGLGGLERVCFVLSDSLQVGDHTPVLLAATT